MRLALFAITFMLLGSLLLLYANYIMKRPRTYFLILRDGARNCKCLTDTDPEQIQMSCNSTFIFVNFRKSMCETRMHSSRMRTARCSSRLSAGAGCLPGGSAQMHTGMHPPTWTGVKTLPCRNYVADGKKNTLGQGVHVSCVPLNQPSM